MVEDLRLLDPLHSLLPAARAGAEQQGEEVVRDEVEEVAEQSEGQRRKREDQADEKHGVEVSAADDAVGA
eukprot:CAMPEP_0175560954 /NCGR_PEP_ID=MMETSP0096-20121207/37168_1 /TAXON_ID=311494 /ORGANISM="Alexandrium monilatum, Strain CCMP3105" /LENGTH=69 /DNA_ID=CAMNT_0016864173 /DNA_START=37 /DNA_END=243 /DNA_ORIENTATION=-